MKQVTLTFHRSELLDDVERIADLLSHGMPKDNHIRHMLADICQDGNLDRLARSMSLAYHLCEGFLHRYTRTDADDDNVLCNGFGWPEIYLMTLNIPDNFSEGSVVLVEKLIHEYICAYVIWDYLSLTHYEQAAEWYAKLGTLEEKIKNTTQIPGGRYRRPLQPF